MARLSRPAAPSLVVALALWAACSGRIGDAADNPTGRSSSPAAAGAPTLPAEPAASGGRAGATCASPDVGLMPLRRLTRAEYDRTVRDLFGDTTRPARAFPADEQAGPFDTNVAAPVSEPLVSHYVEAAESVAARAVARLDALLPCKVAAMGEEACARQLVESLGPRAFRRPLAPEEIARYMALYAQKRASSDFASGVRLVLEALLLSPHFLYRMELGSGAATVVPLGSYDLATRLAYFLWGSAPDAQLLQLAGQGGLTGADALERQARLMLRSERAREAARDFHRQWLGLDDLADVQKDRKLYPQFTDALKSAMRAETEAFVDHVLWTAGGRFETLMTASYSFVSSALMPIYALPGSGTATPTQQALDPKQRAGVLTQPGLLSVEGGVVQRGKFVRSILFCQEVPPPPPEVNATLPEVDADATTRERFVTHEKDPACGGCHRLMDPIGFGFLRYDDIGRFRDTDARSRPIDAGGTIVGGSGGDVSFDGAVELARLVAANPTAHHCLATQWFRFAFGRVPEPGRDDCSLASIQQALVASKGDIRELIVSVVKSDAFRFRR